MKKLIEVCGNGDGLRLTPIGMVLAIVGELAVLAWAILTITHQP